MGASFSISFLPDRDRLVLSFDQPEKPPPFPPVLLTRRLVKSLGVYLRRYVEKQTPLPETATPGNRGEILRFMHQTEVETQPPKWGKRPSPPEKRCRHGRRAGHPHRVPAV